MKNALGFQTSSNKIAELKLRDLMSVAFSQKTIDFSIMEFPEASSQVTDHHSSICDGPLIPS